MGTKRVGLARIEALIENLKRELSLDSTGLSVLENLAGAVADAVTTGSEPTLTQALVCPVATAGSNDKAKMWNSTVAGEIVIVINTSGSNTLRLRTVADGGIMSISAGQAGIVVSSATGDNWIRVAKP